MQISGIQKLETLKFSFVCILKQPNKILKYSSFWSDIRKPAYASLRNKSLKNVYFQMHIYFYYFYTHSLML